ncbi:NAD(P)H-dependent oxidoreductase [Labrys sp. 22185]|uniref:NAD(P)H-dependent oxidoreductase n=1 Tax=Labrys sp. 22185 TaxID=3453888 RepID=UPI003F859299
MNIPDDEQRLKPRSSDHRPFRVLLIAGSQRRMNSRPGLDSKARALMHRMAARMPLGWQVDLEDLGNEHGRPKIQACNGCVSSSMALCVWPCNCYGPDSDHQPDLLWNLHLYERLARSDAWAFIGPINWYGPTTSFKLLFDRLVCMNGGNPRPDLIEKKNTLLAQALERSPHWHELTRNHLEGRTAAFFCYSDLGARDLGPDGRPQLVKRKEWFEPDEEPYRNEREAYQALVWQCRYSGIEVPDCLWRCAAIGAGRLYSDDQADSLVNEKQALATFDAWVDRFSAHVEQKGQISDVLDAERRARSTTQ